MESVACNSWPTATGFWGPVRATAFYWATFARSPPVPPDADADLIITVPGYPVEHHTMRGGAANGNYDLKLWADPLEYVPNESTAILPCALQIPGGRMDVRMYVDGRAYCVTNRSDTLLLEFWDCALWPDDSSSETGTTP